MPDIKDREAGLKTVILIFLPHLENRAGWNPLKVLPIV
jgi:hypothetical protein